MLRLSCGEGSLDKYPPPLIILALANDDVVAQLVQLLLRAVGSIFRRLLNVLASVVRSHRHLAFRLYQFGFFDFLLWKVVGGEGSSAEKRLAADFIAFVHLCQRPEALSHSPVEGSKGPDHLPWHASILRLYLPESLVVRLITEGSEGFISALRSENDTPELVWKESMLSRLVSTLGARLKPYLEARAIDPLAVYNYEAPLPIAYPELRDTVYCTPLYLHNLLDVEKHGLFDIPDPTLFLSSLMQELRSMPKAPPADVAPAATWRPDVPRSLFLLKAQELVLQRYPLVALPSDTEAVIIAVAKPALRICNADKAATEEGVIELLNTALRVLRRICAANDHDLSGVSSSALNFALSVLAAGPAMSEAGSAELNTKLEAAVTGALGIAELAATSREGRRLLSEDSRWKKGFWWTLSCACSAAFATETNVRMSPMAGSTLDCLNHFAGDEQLCDQLITQGLYLPLLLLVVPPPQHPKVAISSSAAVLLNSAVCVLRTLRYTLALLGGRAPTERQMDVRAALTKVMPEGILKLLEDPEEGSAKFVEAAWAHVERPGVVWTDPVRGELRKKVEERLALYSRTVLGGVPCIEEDEVSWLANFEYSCLADHIVIKGVYIRGYANGQWQGFQLSDGAAFCEAVQDWLERHSKEVLAQKERGSDADALAMDNFLVVLAALRECVKHGVQNAAMPLLQAIRYPFLQKLLEAEHLPAVQCVATGIARALLRNETSRDRLLESQLFAILARHLWQTVAQMNDKPSDLLVDTLQAFVALSQSLPATDRQISAFTTHSLLLIILSLFCNVPLRPVPSPPPTSLHPVLPPSEPGSAETLKSLRVLAASILGSLVQASNKVVQQKQHLERTGSTGRGVVFKEEGGMDGHELYHIMGPGPSNRCSDFPVLRTLFLLLPVEILTTLAVDSEAGIALHEGELCSPRLVWGPWARKRLEEYLASQIKAPQAEDLPSWSANLDRPLFLRQSSVVYGAPEIPPFRDDEAEGYAGEVYLSGFYLDQFLQDPEFAFSPVLLDRFLRELRRYIMIAGPSDLNLFDFDDRRRLLLAYLLLSKTWPELVTSAAKVDIFYPVYEIINCGSGEDHRGLSQLAMLVFHSCATTQDVAEYMSTEELIYTLSSYLDLTVPHSCAGVAATDPRFCSLTLMLRLVRLSNKAVELSIQLGVIARLADVISDALAAPAVVQRAVEVLACMCSDRRKGPQIAALLESIVPLHAEVYGSWRRVPAGLDDEFDDAEVLPYFMQHRMPSPWWVADTAGGMDELEDEALACSPVAVLEASVLFPKAKLLEFVGVAESAFKRAVAVAARVSPRCVTIVRKRAGSVIVDFLVTFQQAPFQPSATENPPSPEEAAAFFKETLEQQAANVFAVKYFEPMGTPKLTQVALRQASFAESRRSSFGRPHQLSFSTPPASPAPSHTNGGATPQLSRLASASAVLASPNSPLTYQTGQVATSEVSGGLSASSSTASLSSLPLDEALERVLDGADISAASKAAAKANFLEAFEDDIEELARMVARYPKLIQKFTLQPQLCYDLMLVWEEHCLDLLSPEEIALHGRLIMELDMCRFDEPDTAVGAAQKKYEQIMAIRREKEEKGKRLPGHVRSESAQEPEEEMKQMTKGKIQKKSRKSL